METLLWLRICWVTLVCVHAHSGGRVILSTPCSLLVPCEKASQKFPRRASWWGGAPPLRPCRSCPYQTAGSSTSSFARSGWSAAIEGGATGRGHWLWKSSVYCTLSINVVKAGEASFKSWPINCFWRNRRMLKRLVAKTRPPGEEFCSIQWASGRRKPAAWGAAASWTDAGACKEWELHHWKRKIKRTWGCPAWFSAALLEVGHYNVKNKYICNQSIMSSIHNGFMFAVNRLGQNTVLSQTENASPQLRRTDGRTYLQMASRHSSIASLWALVSERPLERR